MPSKNRTAASAPTLKTGARLTDTDFDGAEEYGNSLSVGIYDADSLSLSPHETMIVLELFICTDDDALCCTFKPEGQTRFDVKSSRLSPTACSPLSNGSWNTVSILTRKKKPSTVPSAALPTSRLWLGSKVNEGKMFSTDIGGNNDEESNYCESCDEHPRLLTRAELTEQIDSWWEVTDTNTREKITGISISRFDGGEIPAYESACQASWDALIDDEKIATWQKYKDQ